ncbi:MAG: TA system VapC family ribonuclease toxin [Cyanobacteriota bacterium]|nr:TA system VapC family ribonuclease toxin [Cyanobacteriota bacterium]
MTPDVNVLVAASRSDHPHHGVAIAWLESALAACLQGERLRLLPMVTAGFLRLVTHSRVFVEPTPLAAAQEFLAALLAREGVEWLHLGEEWPLLQALCSQHQLTGNAISDGWIAAAVLARQEKLVTLDRDFVALLPPRQLTLLRG